MAQIDEETSKHQKLDKKDRQILEILKENSRENYSKIAKKIMLSKDTIAYRIKRMENLGVIDKYSLNIQYSLLGFDRYHILFQLLEKSQKKTNDFYDYLIKNKNIINIVLYSDKWDLKIEIIAKGNNEFDEIITQINNKFSEIILDYEIMQEVKNYRYVRKEKLKILKLDKIDYKIIELLLENSKTSFVEISKKINLSADAIAYRMNNYVKSGFIKRYATFTNVNKEGYHWYDMLFLMKVFTKKQEDILKGLIKTNENVIKAIKTIGECNILLSILAKNPEEFHLIAKTIRTLFQENIKDYDTLLTYKELKNKRFIDLD